MPSKNRHMQFIWSHLLTRKAIGDKSTVGKTCNDHVDFWSHGINRCLYTERETLAEIKIMNFLIRTPRMNGGIETRKPRKPSDAEIIFGDCDCEALFCTFKRGWDKSRIDWLWDLERLERLDKLQRISRKFIAMKSKIPRLADPEIITLQCPEEPQPKKIGCWSWVYGNCGNASDTVGQSSISK